MSIKSLAGQTMWYGVSSIAARFVNYLLTPILTAAATITVADYGRMSSAYAMMPLMNVIFTYGMETTYFRFIQKKEMAEKVNATASISLLFSTVILTILLWFNQGLLVDITMLSDFPQLIQLSILIISLDALSAIPFAKLRNEGRPKLFALIKVAGIIINFVLTVFFVKYCPYVYKETGGNSWVVLFYNPATNPIVYVMVANVMQSAFTLLLLAKWLIPKKFVFNFSLWKEMLVYAAPMLVVGLGGMINETMDRLMLGWWLPADIYNYDTERGIYSACYKLSLLISLFIQAFRMGAEPFFFREASEKNAPATYARVMKFFVITVALMFLVVSLYLPLWKYFIQNKDYWAGLKVVPILLLANISLGIYYNLSVWYKITNKTMAGGIITLIGAAITISINWLFIPTYSYVACAWATFFCYTIMMIVSYLWGQKHFFVPYAWKKLLSYIVIALLLFFLHKGITSFWINVPFSLFVGTVLLIGYALFIIRIERKEFAQFPVIGKYLQQR